MYRLFQEMAWMSWSSVLKELAHFIAEGCLQTVFTAKANTVLRTESGGVSTAWAQSSCPERKWKRWYHAALTSAFDFVIYNSAVDLIMEWTDRKRASRCRAGAPYRQAGRIPQCQAKFSAAVGYVPQLSKILGKGGWPARKMPDSPWGWFCFLDGSQRLASIFN